MWSEREIAIAKSLTEPDVAAFLQKVFVGIVTMDGKEVLEKNIVALNDEEYGKLMKIHYLAKEENKKKLALIKQISVRQPQKEGEQKSSAIAPR